MRRHIVIYYYLFSIHYYRGAARSATNVYQLGASLPRSVGVFEIKIPLRGIGGKAPNLNFDKISSTSPPLQQAAI